MAKGNRKARVERKRKRAVSEVAKGTRIILDRPLPDPLPEGATHLLIGEENLRIVGLDATGMPLVERGDS